MFHVVGLRFIKRRVDRRIQDVGKHQTLSLGVVTLCITLLHVVEMGLWACMFLFLGALTDRPTAVLYSLNALTAFGHMDVELQRKWQLIAAILDVRHCKPTCNEVQATSTVRSNL